MALTSDVLLLLLLFLPSIYAQWSQSSSLEEAKAFEESLLHQACLNITDHEACTSRISIECHRQGRTGPISILHGAVRGTIDEALRAVGTLSGLAAVSSDLREEMAIHDCVELLGYSIDELGWSLEEISRLVLENRNIHHEANLRAWLSAALSNQDTCLEGFDGTDGRIRHYIHSRVAEVTQLVSNLLVMYRKMRSIIPHAPPRNGTKSDGNRDSPPWVVVDQELLHADPKALRADAVVASDGSGRYRSINEAVNRAPSHSSRRYVIYVKKGVYEENVELKKKKTNIMIVGDGMGITVISGSRNFMQGWTTFRTATFAVSGQGFIARDITFRNTAGPQNHQAVALRVDSDRSAFFRCSIEGYQDTLYAHSLRQFYRECNIYGTIDFIFGNGLTVLQRCNIYTRRPLPEQKVTITAQGRKDPNQNTGISIHDSFVHATYPTYLGRPWKPYSRTVFMQSYLSSAVQPAGWLEWAGDYGLGTLWYGEYRNYGPGARLGGRVRWPGYHVIRDAAVASLFTVRRFIDGSSWLPATGIEFTADLINK
ncbi:putative pectinesterase/pectinesterase inhibitor 22 [Musa acuminata AAA Group]|uniref:putative pectinesterase/pectinesterase inhibitor 22 n=1 Tax=Musa acuminata AAA Group TaxID=214697 RepID=UPI0031D8492D